jgi:hypothetical protein
LTINVLYALPKMRLWLRAGEIERVIHVAI